MEKIKLYVQESYNELMNKVSWPTWAELQESATTVLITTVIIGVLIYVIDIIFSALLSFIYGLI
ncbi:MAG: preprotein translocase subunit SecE [Bacteroidetes bacterium]|nr:preprotein translocase subunit SecE [Bacteroidota bacterium]MBL0050098.1 preprotein translocase subunit SecE [Bacteroidota bacterium]